MPKILIVDDEEPIVDLVAHHLNREGYQTLTAFDGEEALARARSENPDLVILDVMLPGVDGIEVCQTLRRENLNMPVLMLSARGEEVDKVVGLSIGADDYLTKPFSTRELVARVKALLRRYELDTRKPEPKRLQFGDLIIDVERYEVIIRGERIDVTPKEFELLRFLANNAGKVLTRDLLLEKIWDYAYDGGTRTVDVHIRRLREKIERDPANPEYIETVYGIGYRFREPTGKAGSTQ